MSWSFQIWGTFEGYDSAIQLPTDGSTKLQIHMNPRKIQKGYDLKHNMIDLAPVITTRDARFMRLQTRTGAIAPTSENNSIRPNESTDLSNFMVIGSESWVAKRVHNGDIDRTRIKRFKL